MSKVSYEVDIDMLAWAKNFSGNYYGKEFWYATNTVIIEVNEIDNTYYILIGQVDKARNNGYSILTIDSDMVLEMIGFRFSIRSQAHTAYNDVIKKAELVGATIKKANELGLPYNWVAAMELV